PPPPVDALALVVALADIPPFRLPFAAVAPSPAPLDVALAAAPLPASSLALAHAATPIDASHPIDSTVRVFIRRLYKDGMTRIALLCVSSCLAIAASCGGGDEGGAGGAAATASASVAASATIATASSTSASSGGAGGTAP